MIKMSLQRDFSIDIAKGICIFLMVMGHAAVPDLVFKWIYSFHMPFFFIVSGMFFNPAKYSEWSTFLKARVRSLVIPYFTLSLIAAGLFYLIGENYIKAMFVGWGGIALWFIPVLFVSELMFWGIWKGTTHFKHQKVCAIVCVIIMLFVGFYLSINDIHIPLQLEVVGMGGFFYAIGYIFNDLLRAIRLKIWMVCVLMCVYMGIIQLLPTLDMCPNNFACFPLNQILAVAGSVLIICLARVLADWNKENPMCRFFNWAGRNTLVIVGFSQVIIAILNHYGSQHIGIVFSIVKYVGIWGILYLIARILNRYLPFVVGK